MTYKIYEVRVHSDGAKEWYQNGKLHREDGPAVEWSGGGTKFWYQNGKLHREDGPAIEYSSGSRFWFLNGKRHREDGPAYEYYDGTKDWFLEGTHYTEAEFLKKINPPKELTVSEVEKLLGYPVKIVKENT